MLIKGILPVIRLERQKRGFAFPYTTLQESNVARAALEGGHARMHGMKSITCVIGLIHGILPLTCRRHSRLIHLF
jgi:hypothetical protein